MIRIAIGLTACSVFALGLGGCAGLNAASTTPTSATAATSSTGSYVVDSEKMVLLERSARRQGVSLMWVNPPYKKAQAGS